MIDISIEDYAVISCLSPEETVALRAILDDPVIFHQARFIADTCFIPEGIEPIPQFPESPELAKAWFAAAYLGAGASYEHFKKLGFPEKVWRDTLSDLVIWLRNEERNSSVIGLGPLARDWEVVLYHGGVTRHGRLECNSEYFFKHGPLLDAANKIILDNGAPVINLHIPEDGPMKMSDCGESMRRMAEFFDEYRSDFKWQGFICQSWLLDRQLVELLPENSNILKFQKWGVKYLLEECHENTVFRIFGNTAPDAVADPTFLQRNAVEFIRNGGKFRSEGIYVPREAVEAVNYDLEKLIASGQ